MIDKYYKEIKNNLIDDDIYSKVKDYSKEKHKVETYFKNGELLNYAGNHYGEKIIKEYSQKLIKEVNKKYNERTLRRMRQFYRRFCDIKWSTMSTKLSWSHYTELLPIKNDDEMLYYLNLCINYHIDVRTLREKIKNKEYFRLPIGTKNRIINEFNIKYNCYVVVELKVTEFKVEYISQVQKYMNYIDRNIKEFCNNNTMGILICKRENKFVIEYCSDDRIAVREYKLV